MRLSKLVGLVFSVLLAVGCSQTGSTQQEGKPMQGRKIYYNRVMLTDAQAGQLENLFQGHIPDGRYWYDKTSGAWGMEGGPTAGFVYAGMDLPGPMPADISGKGTGVFINGREIHPLDKQGLQQLFGSAPQGRYWLDAQGNLGPEGGVAVVNVAMAIAQVQSRQGGGSVSHGYPGTGARGTLGSDGEGGSIYSGTDASGKSVFWFPGM
ncbi:MAG: hypothetical protein JNN05_05410 [Candidatus Omnitrophica bacterium]|nr:hypothetical protein [Candidatus Omnitrophota bacterium]